jgi:hypothetical protein
MRPRRGIGPVESVAPPDVVVVRDPVRQSAGGSGSRFDPRLAFDDVFYVSGQGPM